MLWESILDVFQSQSFFVVLFCFLFVFCLFFCRRLPHIIPCFQNYKLRSHAILVFTHVCVYGVDCCHKHLTGVLTTPPPSSVPVFLYLTSNPSVPNFLHSRVWSSHLHRLSSYLSSSFFFFFLEEVCGSNHGDSKLFRTSSQIYPCGFPHVYFGFSWGTAYLQENQTAQSRVLSLWGIITATAQGKNRKVFFGGEMELKIGEHLQRVLLSLKLGQDRRDHHSFILLFGF